MSKGYLLIANNTDTVDYIQLAYACALSIKHTQPLDNNQVTLITDTPDAVNKLRCGWVFNNVIEYIGPKGMDSRSRAYDLSPYDETVLLDSDMLFLKPMNHYWYYLEKYYLYVANSPQNYKAEAFNYGFYRKIFEEYNLPDVYNAWTYFKKDINTAEFFDLVKLMTDNPEPFIKKFIPNSNLKTLPTDESFALAIRILDIEDEVTGIHSFPAITHMKPMVQGWKNYHDTWKERVRFNINTDARIDVKIGVWAQKDLLHYVDKEIITSTVIESLETDIWKRKADLVTTM
jgi:hypothetical protein